MTKLQAILEKFLAENQAELEIFLKIQGICASFLKKCCYTKDVVQSSKEIAFLEEAIVWMYHLQSDYAVHESSVK